MDAEIKNNEMNIDEIVTRAIPREDCPVKESGAQHRREQLKKRIEDYTAEQLSKQFNARPFMPDMEYKNG